MIALSSNDCCRYKCYNDLKFLRSSKIKNSSYYEYMIMLFHDYAIAYFKIILLAVSP